MPSADPRKNEPEIMPPVPDVEPAQRPVEIPQDKDAPERQAPERAARTSLP